MATWRSLDHKYILPFIGVYESADSFYLISPFAENGSLSRYLKEHLEVDRVPFVSALCVCELASVDFSLLAR